MRKINLFIKIGVGYKKMQNYMLISNEMGSKNFRTKVIDKKLCGLRFFRILHFFLGFLAIGNQIDTCSPSSIGCLFYILSYNYCQRR
jgi:hypothetical protein